ncbi:MAG: hypothetical protein FJ280_19170 [Planctomycetes bacterium]|nr:hypothetical protein [Planctomycetota bacterium]
MHNCSGRMPHVAFAVLVAICGISYPLSAIPVGAGGGAAAEGRGLPPAIRTAADDLPVRINEIMASNSSVLADPQGRFEDWVELHNPSRTPVNVGGLYLTDDASAPAKWRIPTGQAALTTIPAGGFLIIWADGDTANPGLHANFRLNAEGDSLYLFDSDGSTRLDGVEFGPQYPNLSYGRYPDGSGEWQFLSSATPGRPNVQTYAGLVGEVWFSHERGFYEQPFQVALMCDTPDAAIYYTVDGSEPYQEGGRFPNGTPYTQPIRIAKTTCLRAMAVKPGWRSSRIETRTYIFLANVLQQSARPADFPVDWKGVAADYEMAPAILSNPQYAAEVRPALLSIPSLSLVMTLRDLFDAQTGIYANPQGEGVAWERPGSVELIYPDGTPGFQVNCGVRVQGGYFRTPAATRKHSFRLLFKGIYGATKLRYPLFGKDAAQEFDTVVLRGGANDGYSWSGNEQNATYLRDQFVRDLQRDTGHAAPHGTFVHLYVNGLYWGLYNPCERPDGSFSSSYHGGDKEDWDVFKHRGLALDQGDRTALSQMQSQCQAAATSYEALLKLQGKGPDGAVRPGYPCLLDLTNYVDYMIVNMWVGNWDWPWNNYWLARDRTPAGTGFKFYCWDAEDVMLTSRSPLNVDRITSPDSRDVGQFHALLQNNPEYRLFFADRIHRLLFNTGILTPGLVFERYLKMASVIEKAVIPEAARWGDMHGRNITPAHWAAMRDRILSTYLPQRTAIVLGQFRTAGLYPNLDAPVFYVNGIYQHGGHAAAGARLSLGGSAIWYTLDGTDPRLPGQAAQGGSSVTLVAEDAPKRVLVPTGPVDNAWRSSWRFNDSTWTTVTGSPGGVGYERGSGYGPFLSIDLGAQMYNKQATCYIRIPFTVPNTTYSSLLLKMRYDDGFIAYLNGTEVARRNFTGTPQWNSVGSADNPDAAAVVQTTIDISAYVSLLAPGTNLLAIHGLNGTLDSSDFLISVELAAMKAATSSAPTADVTASAIRYTGPIVLSESAVVKARAVSGTTWSALNEAVFAVGPVTQGLRISEIMYHPLNTGHPNDPNTEYIELTNIAAQSINLNLVRFTKGIGCTFPSFTLPPGGYCLVVKDLAAFQAKYGSNLPVVGQYTGSLDNGGERIELVDAAGQIIQSFRYEDNWFKSTDGQGYSLTVKDPSSSDVNSLNEKAAWKAAIPSPGRENP